MRTFDRRPWWFAALPLALSLLLAAPAAADTFRPTRFDDPIPNGCKPGNCSLREATMKANNHAGADVIRLSAGTYRLTIPEPPVDPGSGEFGDLDLTGEATLVGAGAKETVIRVRQPDGALQEPDRVLLMQGTFVDFRIRNLTLRGGATDEVGGGIGAFNLFGTVLLDGVVVKRNRANDGGGGVFSAAAELTIKRSTIHRNEAGPGLGGGVFLAAGGGSAGPMASIRASTISENTAPGGAGIAADGFDIGGFPNPPTITALNSTIVQNRAAGNGGGVSATNAATVSLDNVTVAWNSADSDAAGGGVAGGVYHATGGAFELGDTAIAGNMLGVGAANSQCAGAFTGQGGVVVQLQAGTACAISGDIEEPADALVALPDDNGGPTRTSALFPGSAAIGFAESCPAKDQRGVARPATDCDSGAFEHEGP